MLGATFIFVTYQLAAATCNSVKTSAAVVAVKVCGKLKVAFIFVQKDVIILIGIKFIDLEIYLIGKTLDIKELPFCTENKNYDASLHVLGKNTKFFRI